MNRAAVRSLSVSLVAYSLCTAIARSDSYAPYPNQRVTEATGRYYVILTREGGGVFAEATGPVRYVLARSRPGTAPVNNATSDPENLTDRETAEEIFVYKPDESLIVRAGDEILGSGRFELPPELVCVSPTGLGFLAAGVYGFNGAVAPELNIVDGSGRIVHRKGLEELFSKEEIEAFPAAMLRIAWVRGAWYDAGSGEIVVVARGPLLRVIAVDSGKVRDGGEDDILRALSRDDQDARRTALELVAEMKMRSATGPVYRILDEPKQSLGVRLRAAVASAVVGDGRGATILKATLQSPSAKCSDEREYALRNLHTTLGRPAVALLAGELKDGPCRDVAYEELMAIRGEAVPDALEELERLTADPNQQVRRLAKQIQQTLRTKALPPDR